MKVRAQVTWRATTVCVREVEAASTVATPAWESRKVWERREGSARWARSGGVGDVMEGMEGRARVARVTPVALLRVEGLPLATEETLATTLASLTSIAVWKEGGWKVQRQMKIIRSEAIVYSATKANKDIGGKFSHNMIRHDIASHVLT